MRCAFLSTATRTSHDVYDRVRSLTPEIEWMGIEPDQEPKVWEEEKYAEYDYVFVFRWPRIIRPSALKHSKFIGFHTSNLPHGRGGSPLQNQIIDGIELSRVNAIQLSEKVDAGPIYCSKEVSLQGTIDDVWRVIGIAVSEMISKIVRSEPIPVPQEAMALSPYKRRTDNRFGQTEGLDAAYRFIQMLDGEGYPHAHVDVGPYRIELSRASLRGEELICDAKITVRRQES